MRRCTRRIVILVDDDDARFRRSLLSGKSALAHLDMIVSRFYSTIICDFTCAARIMHPVKRRGSPGLKRWRTHPYIHMHARNTREYAPVRSFLCVSIAFLPSLRHETHRPSRTTIESARSCFEGQMALKSVYNSSRNSAPDWWSKRGCLIRRKGYDRREGGLKKGDRKNMSDWELIGTCERKEYIYI